MRIRMIFLKYIKTLFSLMLSVISLSYILAYLSLISKYTFFGVQIKRLVLGTCLLLQKIRFALLSPGVPRWILFLTSVCHFFIHYISIHNAKIVSTITSEIHNLFEPNWDIVLILQISWVSLLIKYETFIIHLSGHTKSKCVKRHHCNFRNIEPIQTKVMQFIDLGSIRPKYLTNSNLNGTVCWSPRMTSLIKNVALI